MKTYRNKRCLLNDNIINVFLFSTSSERVRKNNVLGDINIIIINIMLLERVRGRLDDDDLFVMFSKHTGGDVRVRK